jgi:hypothetical protein
MPIPWTLTREQRKFQNELFIPLARHIGLIVLVVSLDISLLLWTAFNGSLHRWVYPIMIGGFCAIQILMFSWVAYINARRRKLSTTQE